MSGYLPDGTPMNRAGNAINHPENIQPDPHTPGAPLPRANLHNSIGYLPDGTPMNAAGNALNHPERMQPDMHITGSPLPKSHYAADVGYLVDGTDLMAAGNNFVKAGVFYECECDSKVSLFFDQHTKVLLDTSKCSLKLLGDFGRLSRAIELFESFILLTYE